MLICVFKHTVIFVREFIIETRDDCSRKPFVKENKLVTLDKECNVPPGRSKFPPKLEALQNGRRALRQEVKTLVRPRRGALVLHDFGNLGTHYELRAEHRPFVDFEGCCWTQKQQTEEIRSALREFGDFWAAY